MEKELPKLRIKEILKEKGISQIDYCINGFKTIKQRGIMAW